MIKFLLRSLLFFAFTPTAFASVFESPYIGVTLGGMMVPFNTIGERHLHLNLPEIADLPVNDQWHVKRKTSLNYSFHVGKGVLQDKYYTGLELSLNHARERISASSDSSADFDLVTIYAKIKRTDKLKISLKDWETSLDVRQGYLFTPDILGFVKFGLSTNKVIISLASSSIVKTPLGEYPMAYCHSLVKRIYPVRLGFGCDYKLREHISLRADYTYIRYGKFHMRSGAKAEFGNGDANLRSADINKISLHNSVVMFGLNYHF